MLTLTPRRLLATSLLWLLMLGGGLAPSPAQARTRATCSPRLARSKPRRGCRAPVEKKAKLPALRRPALGLGNVPGCLSGGDPTPWLHAYRATVLHVIVDPTYGATGSALPCVRDAAAAGFRVNLAIQWWNPWRPQQVAAFTRSVLQIYAPYLWAVSLGNEQELYADGRGMSGRGYAADWAAAEPVLAGLAPNALRVAGEISPWGLRFLADALRAGLTGVQALAGHPYSWRGCFAVSHLQRLASAYRLPVWYTEGLRGRDSFGPDRPLSELRRGGVDVVWLKSG